jgi:hypothetical protein
MLRCRCVDLDVDGVEPLHRLCRDLLQFLDKHLPRVYGGCPVRTASVINSKCDLEVPLSLTLGKPR